ncbi:MAG: 4-hydroxybutyrate CoA-transferase, partial [Bacteroidales bacterium]|nr:4-hydroxybutyrate CoA-transferase [Bacteroidales bacterium]
MSKETFISAREAVQAVRSGDHIHLSSIASVPHILIEALCERAGELRDVHFHHFHTEGPAPYGAGEFRDAFFDQGFFVGPNLRAAVQEGIADYIPTNLFESQLMYRTRALPCDVALVQVSEPVDGMVSLGTSVDCSLAALEVARERIAVVNPDVPFAYGDLVPIGRFTALVRDHRPLYTKEYVEPSPTDMAIGRYCAQLIPDGACLQMGIGGLPNAVCAALKDHRHLGLHTEMFSDGALELIREGIIDNSCKAIDKGKTVASFLLGSRKVYDFIPRNPGVQMRDIA